MNPPTNRPFLADFGKGTMLTHWEQDGLEPSQSSFVAIEVIIRPHGWVDVQKYPELIENLIQWWELPQKDTV